MIVGNSFLNANIRDPLKTPSYLYPTVYPKLKELIDSGAFVFIITNQCCIENQKWTFREISVFIMQAALSILEQN